MEINTSNMKKIGELVSSTLNELFNNNIISKLEIELMETKAYSKDIFSITYPLLIKENNVDEKKNKRYWKETINIYGVNYRICNDWYENEKKKNNRPSFECWFNLKQCYKYLNENCKSFIDSLRNEEVCKIGIISLLNTFYNNGNIKIKISKHEISNLYEEEINKFFINNKDNFYIKENEYCISDKIKPYIKDQNFIKVLKESIDMLEYKIKGIVNEEDTSSIEQYNEIVKVKDKVEFIQTYIQNSGFKYEYDQIVNFYLSLKTKPFVILSGISGTGKSKLVKLLAESLGATSENNRFTLVPVRPDWSDSSELLGYKDLNGTFHPGILTTIIEDALKEENKNYPYFVCLDEMNLARVEYYLSDILSVIESRYRSNNGEIKTDKLIRKELLGNDQDAIQKYSDIYIPENLYIIGTVNMDETTFPFSKKVLDRANTIEFNDVNLGFNFESFDEETVEAQEYTNSLLKSKYIKLIDCKEEKEEATKIINQLIKINNILEKYNQQFGYRVRDEIVYYCLYALNDNLFTFEEAIDYCIAQKILPKIGGSDEDTLDLLIDLYNELNNTTYTRDDFDSNRDIKTSDKYKLTNKKILIMVRRFVRDGFTNFWQ